MSGELVAVGAHLQDCAEDLILGKDRAAGPGVPFADRAVNTNGADVFARERRESFHEPILDKHRAAGMAVAGGYTRGHGMSLGDPLLDKHRAAGVGVADVLAHERRVSFREALPDKHRAAGMRVAAVFAREVDAPRLDKKFFGEDFFAGKTGAPPFAGLVAADEHGVPSDRTHMMAAAGEALRSAPSSPHAAQVTIDVAVIGGKAAGVPTAADAGGRGCNLSTVVGIVAASSAVTMVAAGAVSPPVAFGTFLLLLCGLSVAVSGVLGN